MESCATFNSINQQEQTGAMPNNASAAAQGLGPQKGPKTYDLNDKDVLIAEKHLTNSRQMYNHHRHRKIIQIQKMTTRVL